MGIASASSSLNYQIQASCKTMNEIGYILLDILIRKIIFHISVSVTSNLTNLLLRRHLPLRIHWNHCWKRIEHGWRWDRLFNINGLNNMPLRWTWANIWIRKNVHRLLWLVLHDVEIETQHNKKSLISLSLKLWYIP